MDIQKLIDTAKKMVAPEKGLLAADESSGSLEKRFTDVGISLTQDLPRDYRELLFTTSSIETFLSGVILFDETIRQKSNDGVSFPMLLKNKGIIPGIKVDKKTFPLVFFPGEQITEGLDGLRGRLSEYVSLGAEFTKWRAVITIGDNIPTKECIDANAHALARYASIVQESNLVPIVEPEVLMDGDHTIERCEEVTTETLKRVFSELEKYKVNLKGIILKPNMVLSGRDCKMQADVDQIAKATIRCLKETVPAEVPGIVFLSGGQTPDEATLTLNRINSFGKQPWELSFSYGRALQRETLETWGGRPEDYQNAQKVFFDRVQKVSQARGGKLTS